MCDAESTKYVKCVEAMQMTPGKLLIFWSICSMLLFAPLAVAQPSAIAYESIELQVLNASEVAVGHVVDFSGTNAYPSDNKVTIEVAEVLKGNPASRFELPTQVRTDDLRVWKARGTNLLVIVRPGDAYRTAIIDLDSDDLRVSQADFSVLTDREAVLKVVKEVVKHHPGVKSFPGYTMAPPSTPKGEAWAQSYAGQLVSGVTVPADEKLEKWARTLLKSRLDGEVMKGLYALALFKSDKNIALVKSFLKSNAAANESDPKYSFGIQKRRFVFREAADRILTDWKVEFDHPVLEEDIDCSDTVEELVIQPPVTNDNLLRLKKFNKLRSLEVLWGELDAEQLKAICQQEGLRSLGLTGPSGLTPEILENLVALKNIQHLVLHLVPVTDSVLAKLAGLKELKSLDVDLTECTEDGLAEFLKSRPDVKLTPEHGIHSAIAHYASTGNVDGVRRILKQSPNLVDQDERGMTPLLIATSFGQTDVARLLIDSGASLESRAPDGKTPFLVATSRYQVNMECIRLLAGRGADIHAVNHEGDGAIALALSNVALEAVPFLLSIGCDPQQKNLQGKAPLDEPRLAKNDGGVVAAFLRQRDNLPQIVPSSNALCNHVVYSTQANSVEGWTTKGTGKFDGPVQWSKTPSARDYLGPFAQQELTLHLKDIPTHRNLTVEVQLLAIGSWDGNGDGAGPDILDISVPGVGTLLHSSFFSNTEGERANLTLQSFPDEYLKGFHKGYTGASEVKSLGFLLLYPRDAVYNLKFTFASDTSELDLKFTGMTVPQGSVNVLMGDEAWGIGSLRVTSD